MLAGPFVGLPLPLLPAQILWVNLLTHGLPGVALGSEPADPGAMRRPPRPPAESVLGAGLWQRIVRVGVVIAAVTLGVAVWGHATGRPWQSMAFFALGTTQLAVAARLPRPPGHAGQPGPARRRRRGAGAPARRALPAVPPRPARTPSRCPSLDLLIVCALSTLGYAAIRLDRIVHRTSPPRQPGTVAGLHYTDRSGARIART